MARQTLAQIVAAQAAEIAALKAALQSTPARPVLTMAQTREQHVAPCGRGFTSDAKVAEHVAYWAATDRPCSEAVADTRGHGARK